MSSVVSVNGGTQVGMCHVRDDITIRVKFVESKYVVWE